MPEALDGEGIQELEENEHTGEEPPKRDMKRFVRPSGH
jgi:hypothetical protein